MTNDTLHLFKVCGVFGCPAPYKAKGYCESHYHRAHRSGGDPLAVWLNETERTCCICGAMYMGTRRHHKTCGSLACRRQRARATSRAFMAEQRALKPKPPVERHEAVCEYCGQSFMADRRRFRYCSKTCGKQNPGAQVRKDLMVRGEHEPIVRVEIFARDGWVCQLCALPIDPKLAWPDPMSASLDHIVPMSKGGLHLRENTQASHLLCNIRKGNRIQAP